jgi:glycine betaine/choline ABC-type transport system substrate-binding protein
MSLLEPDVALSDFALAIECAILALWLHRSPPDKNALHAWLVLFFAAVGSAALLGGITHGFLGDPQTTAARATWNATLVAIGFAALSNWVIGARLLFSPVTARGVSVLAGVIFAGYVTTVLFFNQSFAVATLHSAPAGGFLTIALTITYLQTRRRYLLPGIAGLALSFAAAALQQIEVGLPSLGLTHNAVYHLFQIIAMLLIFPTALGLARETILQARVTEPVKMSTKLGLSGASLFSVALALATFYLGYADGRRIIKFVVATVVPEKYGGGEVSSWVRQKKENTKVLVFVHGVTGTPSSTWTFQSGSASVYWPKLVEQEEGLKDYDIFVMSYYSPQLKEGPGMFQLADGLYNELLERKIYPDKTGSGQYTEIIFICHSMANLILRNMMITNPLPSDSPTAVSLILSIASPSAGSALAELVEKISDNTVYQEMVKAERNSYLQLLNGVWKQSAFDTEIACAFERKEYVGLGKKIVEEASATSVCTRDDPVGIDEDHISIVKPPDRSHPIHRWLVNQIGKEAKKRAWELDRWTNKEIIVGGKDFPESNLHAAMITLVLRAYLPELQVSVRYGMGHASRLFSSLIDRRVDIYPEYDGSLVYEYLRRPLPGERSSSEMRSSGNVAGNEELVNAEMAKELQTLNLKYFSHFGFHNPYVLVMLRSTAQRLGILEASGRVTISRLAGVARENLVLFSDQDFFGRNEWSALQERYNLGFIKTDFAQHDTIYDRLRASRSERPGLVIVGFGSDAELNSGDPELIKIDDDLGVFPFYYPAPLLDKRLLRKFPGIEAAMFKLRGIMDIKEMADLLQAHKAKMQKAANLSREERAKILEELAAEFLIKKGVLAK